MKIFLILPTILFSLPVTADEYICSDVTDYQRKLLYDPSPAILAMEKQKGRVFIYEGFTDVEIQCILDNYSSRIEYAMFIGTIVTDHDGEPVTGPNGPVIEDDGCD